MGYSNFISMNKCIYYQYNNRVYVYIVKDCEGKNIENLGYNLKLQNIDEEHAPDFNSINLGYCVQGYKNSCVIVKLKSYHVDNIEPYHIAKGLLELFSENAVDDFNIKYGRLIYSNTGNKLIKFLSN